MFLLYVVGEEDPIGFSLFFFAFVLVPSPCCGHCCRRFPVLSHFVFVNRFLFYKRTVVVRSS